MESWKSSTKASGFVSRTSLIVAILKLNNDISV